MSQPEETVMEWIPKPVTEEEQRNNLRKEQRKLEEERRNFELEKKDFYFRKKMDNSLLLGILQFPFLSFFIGKLKLVFDLVILLVSICLFESRQYT